LPRLQGVAVDGDLQPALLTGERARELQIDGDEPAGDRPIVRYHRAADLQAADLRIE
jgi:hypothetical protein